jgi:hypothetical protein
MKVGDIPLSELELLANSEALAVIFAEIEQDAIEQMLRLPWWASRKRFAALQQRVLVVRDVASRIRALRALRQSKQR